MLAAVLALAAAPLALDVSPAAVVLRGPRDGCQLVVTGRFADGTQRDLTHAATVTPDRPGVVAVADGFARPLADGAATLVVNAGSTAVRVPVTVVGDGPPASFRREVVPALGVGGCNLGACHGTPSGKNGFRLSLRGEDPAADFRQLTRDLQARRGGSDPAGSLLLLKGLGRVAHEGGVRLPADSLPAAVIGDWLRSNQPADPPDLPAVVGITVTPAARLLHTPDQQLAVVARFADGTARDVTRLSVFTTNDLSVADSTLTGRVGFKRPGETAVLVRYLGAMASVRLAFVRPDPHFAWPDPPARTALDAATFNKLRTLGIAPADLCSDAVFVRRAHLDALGRLPTPEEAAAFLAAPDRDALIDSLLGRPEFADWWAMKWADVLRAGRATLGDKGAGGFHLWLRDRFAAGTPLDALARELLTASGDTRTTPAAGYWRTAAEPQARAEAVAQLFLGSRLGCAKCHNHPFERWTQDDYHALSAVFARVKTRPVPGSGARERVAGAAEVVVSNRGGEVVQPRTGKAMRPDVPGGGLPDVPPGADRRAVFADWLVTSPAFARATANRVWFHLLGRGVVDPVDDLRDSNPPSNDALLDALTAELVAGRFDLRHLVREVMRSRVYQLAAGPGDGDGPRYFAAAAVRLLTAEQLLDAVCDVTGLPEKFSGQPPGTRAVQLPDGDSRHPFLKAFGRPARELPCECERTSEAALPQALHLLNGATVAGKITAPGNRLGRLLAAGATDDAILDDLYRRAVSRPPTAGERELALAHVRADDRRGRWEDVLWAVLNGREFLHRH